MRPLLPSLLLLLLGGTFAAGAGGTARAPAAPPLRVAMAAGEAVPFIKTGGLADVTDALSRGLAARGHEVTLFLPRYETLDPGGLEFRRLPGEVLVPLGGREVPARLLRARRQGVDVVLLENERLFAGKDPYGGAGYGQGPGSDDKFLFFSRGVLEAFRTLGLWPDILHAHDWQAAGMIPMARLLLPSGSPGARAKSVLTIHNAAFQGDFPPEAAGKAGFSPEHLAFDRLGHHGRLNLLKAGIQYGDAVTTVSPTYAREIRTDPRFGMGLEGVLSHRSADLHGILNGVDPALWDPASDAALPRTYSPEDAAAGKAAAKAALQAAGGLEPDPGAPLFAVVSRLTRQKGIDLAVAAAPELLERGGQLAVLGSGEPELEALAADLARRHPGRVWTHPFDLVLPRLLFAASDFLLMPSRFEPCGLSQLMAQRYGSLPVATPVGGLLDTVTDAGGDPARGDGFLSAGLSIRDLRRAVRGALALHADPAALSRARRNAMGKDSSWEAAVGRYLELYRGLLGLPREG